MGLLQLQVPLCMCDKSDMAKFFHYETTLEFFFFLLKCNQIKNARSVSLPSNRYFHRARRNSLESSATILPQKNKLHSPATRRPSASPCITFGRFDFDLSRFYSLRSAAEADQRGCDDDDDDDDGNMGSRRNSDKSALRRAPPSQADCRVTLTLTHSSAVADYSAALRHIAAETARPRAGCDAICDGIVRRRSMRRCLLASSVRRLITDSRLCVTSAAADRKHEIISNGVLTVGCRCCCRQMWSPTVFTETSRPPTNRATSMTITTQRGSADTRSV